MAKELKVKYVKRTQKDYSTSFKLQVVQSIERGDQTCIGAQNQYGIQGSSTVLKWLRKYGSLDWENKSRSKMPKTPDQRIMELEARVKQLEKQKKSLEQQVEQSDKKSIIFDMMIEIAEKEYKIPIRKNSLPEQLNGSNKNKV